MKILIVRFSSIGDIVLTSPIIRCLKAQLGERVEIHFLSKVQFTDLLIDNPFIDKLYTIKKDINEVLPALQLEDYTHVVDLHKNLRSKRLISKLKVKHTSFPKLNVEKWLLTNFKVNKMPKLHIVDRYFEAVKVLGVKNDMKGLDFFIRPGNEVDITKVYGLENYKAIAIGAQFATKRLPFEQLKQIIATLEGDVVLLGGPTDTELGDQLKDSLTDKSILNLCGKLNLQQSASVLKQASVLLTHDTGLMHIASAFEMPIVSVWGNTVPDLGMYAYMPAKPELVHIHEVKDLKCRPCSKIGYKGCPKKHFNCMVKQDVEEIVRDVNGY
ncbi:ADP-heptose:LPS heptosyltransferase [Lishizhenia tianjinensis]|uniref:ADP-heptose:LPS heptosyltransferase n=1 Tax=Lishizhenia tianjinensis TaxID=477690 RepID=A0A1I7BDY5_9FLAO|nr:glycosyltransferase family 9 protein [Lishizhenia tianjinensis]SFT85410.1 ADP-heptose:LPS heptosyltransferase [Lishizhenia tianjinensis]